MGKLTVNIPEEMHQKVRDEVASDDNLTTSMVIYRAIEAYYNRKENKTMNENTKTLALQISEELFERIQDYLTAERERTGKKLTQKAFIIGLIEKALDERQQTLDEADEEYWYTAPEYLRFEAGGHQPHPAIYKQWLKWWSCH